MSDHRPAGGTKNLAPLLAVLWGCVLGFITPLISAELDATFADGTFAKGSLQGQSASRLRFVSSGVDRPLTDIRRVTFPQASPSPRNASPLRIVHLAGDEHITAEWLGVAHDQIRLRWRGDEITLPRHAILAVDQLPEERQILFNDFQPPDLAAAWKADGDVALVMQEGRSALRLGRHATISHVLDKPLEQGRLSAAIFIPSAENGNDDCRWELHFGDENTRGNVTIHFSSANEFPHVTHSPGLRLGKQPIRRTPGWRQLTALFDEARFQVLMDSQLLVSGQPLKVPLQSFRMTTQSGENIKADPSRSFAIDAVHLAERVSGLEPLGLLSLESQGQVILESGETLYGDIIALDSQEVRIQSAFAEVAAPWNRVRRVVFPPREDKETEVVTKSSPMGWHADARFQRFLDHPHCPGDRLAVTRLSADDKELTFAHPWLGQRKLPWDHWEIIEPKFFGQSWMLANDTAHLGNQTRPGFLQKQPKGTTWQGAFALEEIPAGQAFVRIKAAELEPAGPNTPPGSPHLAELRNRGLGTELIINGKPVGRLNDSISIKADRNAPGEIRWAIPPGLLKAGANTWRLRQSPMRKSPQEFDDCELGPIVLEIEQTPGD